jgi:hypothetical protein
VAGGGDPPDRVEQQGRGLLPWIGLDRRADTGDGLIAAEHHPAVPALRVQQVPVGRHGLLGDLPAVQPLPGEQRIADRPLARPPLQQIAVACTPGHGSRPMTRRCARPTSTCTC